MAKKKEAPAEGGEEKKGGKGKTIGIGVVVAAVLFVAGGKMMGGGGTAVALIATTTTVPMGEVVTLDAITLNLSDGHLLKVGVAFQKPYEAPAAGGAEGHAAAPADTSDPTKGYARALDIVIDTLSQHTMADLTGPGRTKAKRELVKRLDKEYEGEIEDVYFHQFVMQ